MKNVVTTVFVLAFSFLMVPQLATAGEPPKPEKGTAVGTLQYECGEMNSGTRSTVEFTVTIDFWNVGSQGGEQYQNIAAKLSSTTQCTLTGMEFVGVFSGGPNGTVKQLTPEWGDWTMSVVNGNFIQLNWQDSGHIMRAKIPIQNPEIFSKYDWTASATKTKLEDSMAGFSDLSGQVEVNMPNEDGTYDEENWQFAKLDGRTFPVGTHIKTDEKSTAIISFGDMTTFIMKPQSEIILSSPAAKESMLKLLVGNLWVNVKKMMKDGSMEIEMTQSVLGIKGTIFVLEETGHTSTLKVIEGSVAYTSKTGGLEEPVNTGETLTADKNGLGSKTTFDVNAENASWKNLTDKTGKTGANTTNSPDYFGLLMILAVVGAAVLVFKKKKA